MRRNKARPSPAGGSLGKGGGRSIPALALALGLALAGAACSRETVVKVSLDIPSPAALDWTPVRSLVLAGFREEASVKGLDLSRDLVGFLHDGLKSAVQATVTERPVTWPTAEALADAALWRSAVQGPDRTLILTGRAWFSQESQRALLDPERRELDEGPFKPTSPWASRKAFSLKLDLALIDAATGAAVFRREYQEKLTSDNIRLTADFALYELFGRIRPRLFRALFGTERQLDRYLLAK